MNTTSSDLWTYLTTAQKPVVLYGTGNGADKILDQLILRNIPVSGVFASSGFVRNRFFRGFPVESYETLHDRLGDMIVLICFGTSRSEVLENIDRIARECETYAPDVPVYGQVLFDQAYHGSHKRSFEKVRDMLSDDISRATFDATIQYKLSGDYKLLRPVERPLSDAAELFAIPDPSTFLDLGAYNGDTVLLYTSLFPQIHNIIAVEPDSRNFRKLQENTRSFFEDTVQYTISYLRALVSDHDGITTIDRNKGRGVHETSGSHNTEDLTAATIVTMLQGQKPDLIKLDVEGNELLALEGGRDVIARSRPSLIVSCYHKSEDLLTLPLFLKELVPEYKVYMRHHPHLLCWDTEYYFTIG
ncbi:MAG: FkbM family methyltransferase [Clostridiales bacterium]|nr:FkbM family methyltransferase [Clostridiales bacterium]